MAKKIEFETLDAPRDIKIPLKAHHDLKERDFSDLIEHFERTEPEAVNALGLSSAAVRAGVFVKRMRKAANMTQAQLASKLGVSQARISEVEVGRGSQGPTWDLIERISQACGVELSFGRYASKTKVA